ncbi:hypothetical protein BDZ97DRAFT_1852059 [Flammula alnicola]|nr:hypothetical protein BDZ97DRAFT_1852059 [Flammula alnicola]
MGDLTRQFGAVFSWVVLCTRVWTGRVIIISTLEASGLESAVLSTSRLSAQLQLRTKAPYIILTKIRRYPFAELSTEVYQETSQHSTSNP